MNQFNTDLRNQWEQLSTLDLEEMLQEELAQEIPDDEKVLLLLRILEAREPKTPLNLTQREQIAWDRYKSKRKQRTGRKTAASRCLSLAASMVLMMALLFSIVPQKAEADTFWEMLQRITNTVMEFFSREDMIIGMDHTFHSDNPGLHQVYDAVLELGVTDPMVPMWLPEGYALTEIKQSKTPMLNGIFAIFSDDTYQIVYQLDVYDGKPAHQYYRDEPHYESYEWEGTTYHITRNQNRWSVVWEKDNTECLITLECQEDTLWRILRSIYVTGAE